MLHHHKNFWLSYYYHHSIIPNISAHPETCLFYPSVYLTESVFLFLQEYKIDHQNCNNLDPGIHKVYGTMWTEFYLEAGFTFSDSIPNFRHFVISLIKRENTKLQNSCTYGAVQKRHTETLYTLFSAIVLFVILLV